MSSSLKETKLRIFNAATLPGLEDNPLTSLNEYFSNAGDGYIVVVYDNSVNTYEQVIRVLVQATACGVEEAAIEAWEIDHLGKSVVHHGNFSECNRAAGIIRQIGIRVEVVTD